MGTQHDGPAQPGGKNVSECYPSGAVQVTPGGRPIILMNDRGTMGGYAKPALIHLADLSRAALLRQHEPVSFVFAPGSARSFTAHLNGRSVRTPSVIAKFLPSGRSL